MATNDFYAVKDDATGTGVTELHRVSAGSGWQQYTGHWPTEHARNPNGTVIWISPPGGEGLTGIYTRNTGSGKPRCTRP